MITTSDVVEIHKVLRLGPVTDYTAEKISLFIKHNNIQKRFTAASVLNSTENSNGLIKFENIELWGDGSYSLYVTAENNEDLDVNGVEFDKLATGYINKITNKSLLTI